MDNTSSNDNLQVNNDKTASSVTRYVEVEPVQSNQPAESSQSQTSASNKLSAEDIEAICSELDFLDNGLRSQANSPVNPTVSSKFTSNQNDLMLNV